MTKTDALKAPCPYQPSKLCIADGCPKWRWLDVCHNLSCKEKSRNFEIITGITVYNCKECPSREGYCS